MTNTYKTTDIYLSAFLISQEEFALGKVYIPDITVSNKAIIEIEYEDKFETLLTNFIKTYHDKKAICRLDSYQQNIRFIMKLVNKRKSGITD